MTSLTPSAATDNSIGDLLVAVPSDDQLEGGLVYGWTQADMVDPYFDVAVGMMGKEYDDPVYGEKLFFYMEFQADTSDSWKDATDGAKTFMTLFQMGDENSDWAGVTLYNDG